MTELMPSLCNDCVARNQCGKDDVKMCISYTKEIKIKCDDCKFVEDCVDYGWDGCRKFTPAPSKPITNEDCIRDCKTQDELAKVIVGLCDRAIQSRFGGVNFTTDVELVKEWLQKPHDVDFGAK